ncbi:MAG: hypothetical protein OEM82_04485 [Acidobacteriota bacterium]|nr:hypothetical protein [Acidobacteriota bacterium]MDH3528231.1 hypothetical protein [Acidobacteriota bacterium]
MTIQALRATIPSLFFLVVTLSIFALTILLSTLSLFPVYPELAVGITYDLAFTAPLFYYLAIRKSVIPKATVAGVAVLGIVSAMFLLPANQQTHLGFITFWVFPFLEIGLLGLAGYKAWKALRTYKRVRKENADVYATLGVVFEESIGSTFFSRIAAFEASVFYYAFLGWRTPTQDTNTFSYHKKRGAGALYGVFAFLIFAETIVFHMLIARWSVIAAWIFTISSLYVLLLLFAQFKASYLRPTVVCEDELLVRCGLFCDAEIPLSEIVEIEAVGNLSSLAPEVLQAAVIKGFEPVNILVTTANELTAARPYGLKKPFRKIAFFVDEKERLIQDLLKNDS